MPAYVMPAVAKLRPPEAPNEARFHARYCLAIAAGGHDAILPEHSEKHVEFLNRPEIAAAFSKISIESDPALTHYHQAELVVEQSDGSQIALRNLAPKGSPENPMSDKEVVRKFLDLSEPVVGNRTAVGLQRFVDKLDEQGDLAPFFALLKPQKVG
jgi:2-methylcitrate dehydratase PrpD